MLSVHTQAYSPRAQPRNTYSKPKTKHRNGKHHKGVTTWDMLSRRKDDRSPDLIASNQEFICTFLENISKEPPPSMLSSAFLDIIWVRNSWKERGLLGWVQDPGPSAGPDQDQLDSTPGGTERVEILLRSVFFIEISTGKTNRKTFLFH